MYVHVHVALQFKCLLVVVPGLAIQYTVTLTSKAHLFLSMDRSRNKNDKRTLPFHSIREAARNISHVCLRSSSGLEFLFGHLACDSSLLTT